MSQQEPKPLLLWSSKRCSGHAYGLILIHTSIYVERLRVPTPLFVLIIRVHNNHQLLYTNVQ